LRRITKAALGGLAGCALVLGGTQAASGALSDLLKIQSWGEDLATSTEDPFDSARTKIVINEGTGTTTFTIKITGIGPSAFGQLLGAHLHTGRCLENTGPAAGPHYNHQAAFGDTTPDVNTDTEVWFNLVANEEDGTASDVTTVPFVPVDSVATDLGVPALGVPPSPGEMSVVVHVLPTNTRLNYPNDPGAVGFAGPRQACFPVLVPEWAD
jgi:Cu/Zn superoxide dismutase